MNLPRHQPAVSIHGETPACPGQPLTAALLTELDRMENALARLASQPGDAQALGTVFAAVQAVKASAGGFGLNNIVAFAHVAENMLGKVRQHGIPIDAPLIDLVSTVGEHIRLLVLLAHEGQPPDHACRVQGETLIRRLAGFILNAAVPMAAPLHTQACASRDVH